MIILSCVWTNFCTALSLEQCYQYGVHCYANGDLTQALNYFNASYACIPDNGIINHSLASTYRKLNELPRAVFHYEKALRADPTSGDSAFGLALTLLAQGDNKGWLYFNRWRSASVLAACPKTISDVAGKTIVVTAEWGLGDTIQYIRYALYLKNAGAYIIVQTPAALYPLLRTCAFIDQLCIAPAMPSDADYYIPLLYLPTLCITPDKNPVIAIPYLKKPPPLASNWLSLVTTDTAFKVGICWDIGHHDTSIPAWQRSAPLKQWDQLINLSDVSFYSLQKNATPAIAQAALTDKITDFGKSFDVTNGSFMDCAALMHNLDLVITVDTAIAHLAGAYGIKTWLLLPYSPDHRWQLHGTSTEHYPTMRLFRQHTPGNWREVMQDIIIALQKELCL